jgi:hypothetical protein
MQNMVGVPEPRLMKLLEQLLTAHTSWFKLQHCADPFCGLMGLDVIKLPEAPEGDASAAAGPSSGSAVRLAAPLRFGEHIGRLVGR